MARSRNNLKLNEYVSGLSSKVTNISVVLNPAKKSTHLASPKRKERKVPLKDIVFLNKDQSEETLPSKEKLKLVTDNRQQRKRNKTYADVVVNITDNSVLG